MVTEKNTTKSIRPTREIYLHCLENIWILNIIPISVVVNSFHGQCYFLNSSVGFLKDLMVEKKNIKRTLKLTLSLKTDGK